VSQGYRGIKISLRYLFAMPPKGRIGVNFLGRGRKLGPRRVQYGRRRLFTVGGRGRKTRSFRRRGGRGRGRKRRTRTYKRKRGRRAATKISATAITKALSTENILVQSYGQQQTAAGLTGGGKGTNYFTAEQYVTATVKKDCVTRILDDIYHIQQIADQVWPQTPQITVAGTNKGYTTDDPGRMLVKSKVTYTLRNQSNETASLHAYHCIVRKNFKWDIKASWSTETVNQSLYNKYGQITLNPETGEIINPT